MPFYTRPKHVVQFDYRDFEIEITKAYRGATCCELDHKPRQKVCTECGAEIVPRLVYLIRIDGSKAGVECDSEEEACEFGRALVDEQLSDMDDDDDDDDDDVLLDDGHPETNERGSNKGLILPPPPPPGPRQGVPSNIMHQMKKLGWVSKAMSIIKANPKP